MLVLDRNLPVNCTKCDQMVVKKIMARQKRSCDSRTLSCHKCPNFFTKKEDLNYQLVSEFLFSSTTHEEKAWNFNKSWNKIE